MASTHAHSGDDDDVAIVSTSTPEERNAEKRKHAIDLEAEESKRSKTPSVELETSVAELRSVLKPAKDKKFRERMQPHVEAYLSDQIDAAELEKRKKAAVPIAEGMRLHLLVVARRFALA